MSAPLVEDIEALTRELIFSELIKRIGEKRSLFRKKFNKFNNTRALMLDSINYMTFRLHVLCEISFLP